MALNLDPGLGALGNPALVRSIIEEMDGAAISFQRFMERALYDSAHGYYRRPGRIGKQGDFLTSPVIHPMFGWAIAGWCRHVWEQLGQPTPFTIFEPGAGQGALAASILDWAEGRDPAFRQAIRYIAIEPNAPGSDSRVEWATAPIPAAANGVVLTNELFDALPVRLFDATERGPVEIMVRWDGEAFVEARGNIVTIDDAPTSGRFEVNPGAYPAMQSLCGLIERGAVLTFDYGYPRHELWAPWRAQGTLLCFYRHTAHEDPYIHIGEQDMTTHVDFSELASAAQEAGCTVHGPVRQSAFLVSLGLGQLVESARKDLAEYFSRRHALETLTDAAGLGRVRVLAATRGIEEPLPGFEETP